MVLTERQLEIIRAAFAAFADMDPWGDVEGYLPEHVTMDDLNELGAFIGAFTNATIG